jgi:hypothetical protein
MILRDPLLPPELLAAKVHRTICLVAHDPLAGGGKMPIPYQILLLPFLIKKKKDLIQRP